MMVQDIDRRLEETLRGLRQVSLSIVGSAVVTGEGFVVSSELPDESYERKVTLMSMAMLTMGQETTGQLGAGDPERVLVENGTHYIMMCNAGSAAVLAVIAEKGVSLGLLFLAMKETATRVNRILFCSEGARGERRGA